ncbi:LPS-assembly protein LptD [Tropicimonas sp.]|uniref:LPS-assembly protein LptD n=1 Tax=Tropicimonas sp. TaxID=2067044 RepID=UPI003A89D7D7
MSMKARLLAFFFCLLAPAAFAQQTDAQSQVATLLADRVELVGDGRLIASGNVEAMQGEVRLRASRVVYDQENDRLEIEGPITLTQGPDTVVLASGAALSPDLRDGMIRSARVFIDQQLQLATNEISRQGGRYTLLYNTVASSCQVCAAHPVPLWQIRARSVVHDELERQLYFDHATFEVMGLPVMYLPHLRLPDPTVKRWTGFLTPSLRSADDLGFGIKIPYFITLGDHRDLTVTPYIATSWTNTLELRYRQAFRAGDIELNGAISRDSLVDETRSYLFAEGDFLLPRGFNLDFNIETTSDDAYLLDYDYSDDDRLASSLEIWRARRNELFVGEVINYKSLRSSEDNDTQPFLVGDINWIRRFEDPLLGGQASFSLDGHFHQRRSDEDITGRDVARISGWFDWRRDAAGPWGTLLTAEAVARIDHSQVRDDSDYPDPVTEVTPFSVVTLRWPWVKQGGAAGQVIEPIVQVVWSPSDGEDTPDDESTQLELDEGNLFSLSRFPASDELERGLRTNVGLSWTRYDPDGWSMGVTAGRIIRHEDLHQFDGYASLDGHRSEWLAAVGLTLPHRLSLTNRALFDDSFSFSKNEVRLDWTSDMLDVGTSYIWMDSSIVQDRPQAIKELTLDGEWDINRRWTTALDYRYDFEMERTASARLGIVYRTECASFDFSVRRRFTSTDQLEPTTDYNFEIQLAGFGDRGSRNPPLNRIGCSR